MPLNHIHLDCLGGIAGDMFGAAMADAFPEHQAAALAAASAVAGVPCEVAPHRDSVLTGKKLDVAAPPRGHDHHHAHWSDIRARLADRALPDGVRAHAIGIFAALAEAEARVHGISVDAVAFHEVGAADSIADIVVAAWFIHAVGDVSWSVSPLPLGGECVPTAHGMLPLPAPATTILLQGFAFIYDGIDGERVTSTGAAILRHLAPVPPAGLTERIARTGIGFGTRRLPGMSNIVRVLAFEEEVARPQAGRHRELAVIAFEIDDQSAEDLATGLDRLRALPGVHDVVQIAALGKKGRMATHVQVLARPEVLEAAIETCFRETTTIGLRTHLVQGRALPREIRCVAVGDRAVRVKRAERPDGWTGKAEADDLCDGASHAARAELRREAERLAEVAGND